MGKKTEFNFYIVIGYLGIVLIMLPAVRLLAKEGYFPFMSVMGFICISSYFTFLEKQANADRRVINITKTIVILALGILSIILYY
ncbi:hypothetical protein GLW05_19250 [Pontibacillus yanchengensis]|uniref:Uncharacterized protein n=1 Tax=Pontibacillus yanchengensis TaxID=462910 RepID=A0A6I5A613_9BACI|nr:hypothetical protein [Pontibacillus yanchengensis]MYL35719.1 hypothetical protein [Pontibacillus yanchengensis]